MKLHANAALSLNKRTAPRRTRVCRAGLVAHGRPRPPGELATAGKWVAPLSGRGRGRSSRSLLGRPSRSTTERPRIGSRRSAPCGGCASPAPRSPSCSAMPETTVSAILTRSASVGSAPRARAASPLRALRAPASSSTSTSRSSGGSSGAPAIGSPAVAHYIPTRTDRRGDAKDGRLGVRPRRVDDATRLPTPRCSLDEKAATAVGFLRRALALLSSPRLSSRR